MLARINNIFCRYAVVVVLWYTAFHDKLPSARQTVELTTGATELQVDTCCVHGGVPKLALSDEMSDSKLSPQKTQCCSEFTLLLLK